MSNQWSNYQDRLSWVCTILRPWRNLFYSATCSLNSIPNPTRKNPSPEPWLAFQRLSTCCQMPEPPHPHNHWHLLTPQSIPQEPTSPTLPCFQRLQPAARCQANPHYTIPTHNHWRLTPQSHPQDPPPSLCSIKGFLPAARRAFTTPTHNHWRLTPQSHPQDPPTPPLTLLYQRLSACCQTCLHHTLTITDVWWLPNPTRRTPPPPSPCCLWKAFSLVPDVPSPHPNTITDILLTTQSHPQEPTSPTLPCLSKVFYLLPDARTIPPTQTLTFADSPIQPAGTNLPTLPCLSYVFYLLPDARTIPPTQSLTFADSLYNPTRRTPLPHSALPFKGFLPAARCQTYPPHTHTITDILLTNAQGNVNVSLRLSCPILLFIIKYIP